MRRRSTEQDGGAVHRIGMLIDAFEAGGAERIAVEVAASLDRSRFSPFVIATRHGGPLEEILQRADVDYAILERRHGFSPRKYGRAHRLLRDTDLINSHKLGSNLWGALLSRTTGVPLVALEPTYSGRRNPGRTAAYRWWIAPVSRRIICPSTAVAKSLYDEGLPREVVEVIPNGVRLETPLTRAEARAELGLDSRTPVVGIIALLRPEKAHELVLRATARLRAGGHELMLCIVGDGPRRAALETEAATLGLGGSVLWAGERRDAARLASAFDVGVLCSDYEGMPLAALEILAAGVPLVATAVGTLPEILASGGGVTVPVRDDAALAEAILGYLDDPAAAARAGTQAREQIREHHDFHAFVRSFERVFEQALAT